MCTVFALYVPIFRDLAIIDNLFAVDTGLFFVPGDRPFTNIKDTKTIRDMYNFQSRFRLVLIFLSSLQ